jgi:hypothetical protein
MNRYKQMELLCRQHANLDEKTASSWLVEAEIWSRLITIEHRLQILKADNSVEGGKAAPRASGSVGLSDHKSKRIGVRSSKRLV